MATEQKGIGGPPANGLVRGVAQGHMKESSPGGRPPPQKAPLSHRHAHLDPVQSNPMTQSMKPSVGGSPVL